MTAKADCRKSKRSETRPDGVGSVFERLAFTLRRGCCLRGVRVGAKRAIRRIADRTFPGSTRRTVRFETLTKTTRNRAVHTMGLRIVRRPPSR